MADSDFVSNSDVWSDRGERARNASAPAPAMFEGRIQQYSGCGPAELSTAAWLSVLGSDGAAAQCQQQSSQAGRDSQRAGVVDLERAAGLARNRADRGADGRGVVGALQTFSSAQCCSGHGSSTVSSGEVA